MKEKPIYEQLGYEPDPPFYAATSKPIVTNYDRLISKTPEELADFMANNVGCDNCRFFATCYCTPRLDEKCMKKWLNWLRQEEKDE